FTFRPGGHGGAAIGEDQGACQKPEDDDHSKTAGPLRDDDPTPLGQCLDGFLGLLEPGPDPPTVELDRLDLLVLVDEQAHPSFEIIVNSQRRAGGLGEVGAAIPAATEPWGIVVSAEHAVDHCRPRVVDESSAPAGRESAPTHGA